MPSSSPASRSRVVSVLSSIEIKEEFLGGGKRGSQEVGHTFSVLFPEYRMT